MSTEPDLFGRDLFGDSAAPRATSVLAGRFGVPPFSVLNAREGAWQERKRAWLALGIESELGRGENALALSRTCDEFRDGTSRGPRLTWATGERDPATGDDTSRRIAAASASGTSVFDPVVCELAYRWWAPPGGLVLDPFAGGSVRGIVAALMGRAYHGIELRAEQCEANRAQAARLCGAATPAWTCGDSLDLVPEAPAADFVFSCPPYADLERYSDDPRDLSTMEYHTFLAAYRRIILRACERLRSDRFACFVVGDLRDARGHYRNFVSDTIASFLQCGLALYNEAVLVTMCGSLPLRVSGQFDRSRKLGKSHQNVLVFVKGDAKRAALACAESAV